MVLTSRLKHASSATERKERTVLYASHWWRCADRDRLARLSLSSDHYPAAADFTPGRNGPGQFSQPNTGLVFTGAGIYFVIALALAYWFLFGPVRGKREVDDACPTCVPVELVEPLREPDASSDRAPAIRNMP